MEQIVFNQKLANIGINGIIGLRFFWLLAVTGIVIFFGFGLQDLHLDSSNESFLPKTDELYLANERFKDQFGNEEFVFILVKADETFSTRSLNRLRNLQTDLEERLPFIDEVNTITSVEYMKTDGDALLVEDLVAEEIPTQYEQLEEIKRRLASSRLYFERIVTRDWAHVGIAVTFERMPESVWVEAEKGFTPMDQADWELENIIEADGIFDDVSEYPEKELVEVPDPRKLVSPALRKILHDHQQEDFKLLATGMPIGDYEVDQITAEEGNKLGLLALGVAFFFMLILFRNPVGVLSPLLVMVYAVVILFGAMGWLGIPVSMGSMFVAPLLMVLSVSYSIHFINHFNFYFRQKGERLRAIHYAYGQSTWPCFLTAITTAIGFASFLIVTMKPIRDVGIACGSGALISFILVMIIVPIFYSFGRDGKTSKQSGTGQVLPAGMVALSEFVLRRQLFIILISCLLVVFGAGYFLKTPVETDMLKLLGKDNKFVKDSNSITDILGGYYSYEVFIELENDDDAKNPQHLHSLHRLAEEAKKWSTVKSTMSLVDLVQEISYVMNDRKAEFYQIPDTRKEIAQYLLLYEISGGGELNHWVDYNYSKLRLSVQMSDSKNMEEHINHMRELATGLFPPNTEINLVGDVPILLKLMNLLTIGQLKSIAAAFVVICLVMILILRSFQAGIISMIPNMFPLFIIGGLMGLLQINLDIMTIMIAPMVIGIAVDDTVHFFIHFKDELFGFKNYNRANRQTFIKIGHALLFTTIVLSLGFSILGFSSVDGIVNMGFLAAVGIVAALVADYFIAPVLLAKLRPFKGFTEPIKAGQH